MPGVEAADSTLLPPVSPDADVVVTGIRWTDAVAAGIGKAQPPPKFAKPIAPALLKPRLSPPTDGQPRCCPGSPPIS